jgi:two-component system, NtrC family, sensor kinase
MSNSSDQALYLDPSLRSAEYYRDLQRKNVLRLVLTYLAPLIILSVYFYFQYRTILRENSQNHLRSVAENYAKTMDLFLQERVQNLSNLIDDPKLNIRPSPSAMREMLRKLSLASDAFVDVGMLDASGIQVAYEGPYTELRGRAYGEEPWFGALNSRKENFIVTDVSAGVHGKARFTLAVSRIIEGQRVVLHASLDLDKVSHYLTLLVDPGEVDISLVNPAGYYQLAASAGSRALERSAIVPPSSPRIATATATMRGSAAPYAYAWLHTCEWALIAQPSAGAGNVHSRNAEINIVAFSAAIIALIFSVIVIRSKKIVQNIQQADATRAQLSDNLLHASKLAAVGELASGIAHEINNPLAIINEETGLMQDMISSKFNLQVSLQDLGPHLESVQEAVFRCRDITSKLLDFVRKGPIRVGVYNLHPLIDEVVNSFYGRELAVSNIEIVRSYCRDQVLVLADKTQLGQVLLNLINNAIDAIEGRGRITITTTLQWDERVKVDIVDTGRGMTPEELQKLFTPFYTTKQAGKGTGLGLSISYAIVKSLAGEITVASTPGRGSTFSILLPVHKPVLTPNKD